MFNINNHYKDIKNRIIYFLDLASSLDFLTAR